LGGGVNVGGVGANVGGVGANVAGGGGGAAGASAPGVPVNFPIPGKRSPTVSGLCPGMTTDGVGEGGGGGAGAWAGAVGIAQSVTFGGAGGAAVSQSGGAGVAAGPGTRPSATSRGSTSLVIRSPSGAAYVG
jgi:fibronectin-binding autotransporter adhesin